jgi:pSer/pThr/pTyr-binding forkhead associated (FHA) protein
VKAALSSLPPQDAVDANGQRGEPQVVREEVHIDLSTQPSEDTNPRAKELVALALAIELRQKARALFDGRSFAAAIPILEKAKAQVEAVHGGVPPVDSPLHDLHEALLDDLQIAAKAPKPDEYSVLRKTHMDQQMLNTGLNRGVTQNATPSAMHMVLKLQGQLGPPPKARLVFVEGPHHGKIIPIGPECRIGRGRDNDVVLDDVLATRRHALIQWVGRGFIAHDLGSSSGTFVNGRHIVDDYVLQDGDLIQLGASKLRFERLGQDPGEKGGGNSGEAEKGRDKGKRA